MNAPTFDAHPSTCPICHQSNLLKFGKPLTGLLVCSQCQERLVVSWSGHYVRDPFRLRQLITERSLRRESHPFYRILRDLRVTRPNLLVALLASALLVGIVGFFSDRFAPQQAQRPLANPLEAPRSQP
ncbi:MAG: hypothetical protein NW220_01665 [Leptolyngbyaceae cyanobacterium bins.349]|nr:hypothetical protein [Leptolyngbyaceae cyanobacterium bins.349]